MKVAAPLKLLTCHEADKLFRLRNGTARAAVDARKIRSRTKGRRTYIRTDHAERLWGIP